ncbi:MAG: glutamyl-tRNA amidotransferase [Clostridiales bacterium GWF2_38_85]|nr:MAG: glutamyl-tRNA amidotransferase [Clostridiales bacterium GWF2_38_85]
MKSLKNKLHKLFHPERNQSRKKTEATSQFIQNGGVKRGFRIYTVTVLALTIILSCGMTAFAATDDPLTVVNNLSDFIFGLIRAIGMILLGFGVVQIGLSLKSHDPSQRANGFLTLAGGVVITFAKEILTLITGG